jgi:hypothetical protein
MSDNCLAEQKSAFISHSSQDDRYVSRADHGVWLWTLRGKLEEAWDALL